MSKYRIVKVTPRGFDAPHFEIEFETAGFSEVTRWQRVESDHYDPLMFASVALAEAWIDARRGPTREVVKEVSI